MSQALTVDKRPGMVHYAASGALALAPARVTGDRAATTTKPRVPLSVVPARPVRRRMPFAVFSLVLLAAALAAVLMLNISVSGTQYELVQLRNEQTALSQQNEALVLEIEGKEAPQNLAAAATKLGMVSSPSFGTIELESKRVTGVPEPAIKGAKPEVLIPAPMMGNGLPAPAVVEAAPADAETAPAEASGEDPSTSEADGSIPSPEQLGTDR